ncbi:hypothetical protein [Verrucosispora sp. WMMD1129]|uniref:hypothetical protein n=1 Tax=Verrucosispora sp. WMMD1129 TaxID=3016093 RepID=UPI00249C8AC6|nr:hypothetical protein [Verrucosispora sp. WMMD1129]WFE44264.1 hypothetical protein O7624_07910 [Verrucosispora sp. WMMD1129]
MKIDRKMVLLLGGTAVLFVVAVVFCIAAWAVANAPDSGPERPKVTDWMQAWGSIGGVIAGLAAAGAATMLLLHERQRAAEAERLLAEERHEARLDVPRSLVVSRARFSTYGQGGDYINGVVVNLNNFGATPLRNVALVVELPEDGRYLILRPIPLIAPGEAVPVRQDYKGAVHVPGPWVPRTGTAPVTACFIDHTNTAWEKTSDGEISRTTLPYPPVIRAAQSEAIPA